MSRRALALALSLSLAIPPALTARAEPTAADLAAARKKFDRALELEKAGDFKSALALLRDVAAVKSTSQVRFHVALCLERLGRLVDAREEYLRVKEDAETKEGPESAALAQKCADRVTDLDARIPKIAIKIPDDVVSAKVSVDGGPPVSVIVTPVIRVDPGEHKLQVTSPGRRTFSRTVLLKERDATFSVAAELPLAEADGEQEPEPTATPAAVAPLPRRDVGPKSSPVPWIVGGFGLASLATAGVFYALRDSAIHDLDQACGDARDRCPRSMQSTEDRGRLYTTTANVFLGVGAAAIGTAIVIYATQPSSKRPVAAAVGASASGLSISFTGAF